MCQGSAAVTCIVKAKTTVVTMILPESAFLSRTDLLVDVVMLFALSGRRGRCEVREPTAARPGRAAPTVT